jgi:hypothetical protein
MISSRRLALATLSVLPALPALGALSALGAVASAGAAEDTVLTVRGRGLPGAGSTDFDMAALERLPQQRIVTDTPWYAGAREFSGPLLREVLRSAGVPPQAQRARLVALNDYRVDMPLEDARRHDVIVARLLDGKPMSVREKGPLFVMYPFDRNPALRSTPYYSRCVWQLRTIELS